MRLAKLRRPRNVMAGTDCGFAQGPLAGRVHREHHVGEAADARRRRGDRVENGLGVVLPRIASRCSSWLGAAFTWPDNCARGCRARSCHRRWHIEGARCLNNLPHMTWDLVIRWNTCQRQDWSGTLGARYTVYPHIAGRSRSDHQICSATPARAIPPMYGVACRRNAGQGARACEIDSPATAPRGPFSDIHVDCCQRRLVQWPSLRNFSDQLGRRRVETCLLLFFG